MTNNTKITQPNSFEEAMAELDTIVNNMETGKLPLEQSLLAYQRGAELLKYCQGKLAYTEQQVKILEADMLKTFNSNSSEHG